MQVPRDRNGEFEPKLIPKHSRRLNGFNDIVVSFVARGMSTGDVQARIAEAYQVEISAELVSKITDAGYNVEADAVLTAATALRPASDAEWQLMEASAVQAQVGAPTATTVTVGG